MPKIPSASFRVVDSDLNGDITDLYQGDLRSFLRDLCDFDGTSMTNVTFSFDPDSDTISFQRIWSS